MLTDKTSDKRPWVILALGALVFVAMQAWILFIYLPDKKIVFADSLISNGLLAATCWILHNTLRFYRPGKTKAFNLLPWVFVLAALYLWVAYQTLLFCFSQNQTYLLFLYQSLPIRYAFVVLMLGWFILLSWIWFYLKTKQEEDERKAILEKLAKDAELSNLRQQLQPHFLFNSLNSINALINIKPDEAKRMIISLSDFLRGTLKKDEQQLVKLEDELLHLQIYLDIEKVRFGNRLSTAIRVQDEARSLELPSLLLQPLVENAIKFGLYDTTENVTIQIEAHVLLNELFIEISNPFDPQTAPPLKGTGFGLSSVTRRLYLIYGRNDLLQTEVKEKIFITRIKIPQVK